MSPVSSRFSIRGAFLAAPLALLAGCGNGGEGPRPSAADGRARRQRLRPGGVVAQRGLFRLLHAELRCRGAARYARSAGTLAGVRRLVRRLRRADDADVHAAAVGGDAGHGTLRTGAAGSECGGLARRRSAHALGPQFRRQLLRQTFDDQAPGNMPVVDIVGLVESLGVDCRSSTTAPTTSTTIRSGLRTACC